MTKALRRKTIRKQSYLGNPRVLRSDSPLEYTQEQLEEYRRCCSDPLHFLRTYVKMIHLDKGLINFEPYQYQCELVETFESNRFVIVLSSRQSGKTMIAVGYLLWVALFRSDHNIAILANKGATARGILSRIVLALENIPFFLQPGCRALNKGTVEFANNSTLFAAATSSSSIRGQACNILYLDEFAFVENAAEFYTATYPVITGGKTSQVIITSTANGVGNPFHKIWFDALAGTNEFVNFRVDWWDVPGRDDEWKRQTIANTSEIQFAQEFGNDFHVTGNTLIPGESLKMLKAAAPIEILEDDCLNIYRQPVAEHSYVLTVDCGHGKNQDYSAFSIFDVTYDHSNPEKSLASFQYEQVAVYRNNQISPLLLPYKIFHYARMYNDAFVIVENNDVGILVGHELYMEIEYDNLYLESTTKSADQAIGCRMTSKVKRIGCIGLQELIDKNRLAIPDATAIMELSTFVPKSTGTYAASQGYHDDVVMTMVMFSWFIQTPLFGDMYDISSDRGELGEGDLSIPRLSKLFYADEIDAYIENELPPVGHLGGMADNPFADDAW